MKGIKLKTASVSFGNIVTVSGSRSKIGSINYALRNERLHDEVLIQDVTAQYVNAPTSGMFAKEVQKGNIINLYATGDDIEKIKNKESNYSTIDGIISAMKDYFDANRFSVQDSVRRIMKKG